MTARTTLFTITRKQWMEAIAQWLAARGTPDLIINDWDEVVALEGGSGKTFFNHVSEAETKPNSYPGRWFLSGQTDFSVYNEPRYLYSLLFGMLVVSGSVMSTIGKREAGNRIIDVGGSVFTAYRLLQRGVTAVDITNFEGPQTEFATFASTKFKLSVNVHWATPSLGFGDVFVLSEYLEHFRDVDTELERLVTFRPTRIYESSSFCMPAYGHFIPIKINGVDHTSSRTARKALHQKMASLGYVGELVPCFNRSFYVFTRDPRLTR